MKTFINYLTEDKDRFIKKNKNLTSSQKKEVIKFFKTNRQAEAKVDWNKSKLMNYNDFLNIMMSFKSGRKGISKVKCQDKSIKNLKNGEDYVNVRMKTKDYCAYIPLSYETAQKFNRDDHIGVCSGSWCIGNSSTKDYWSEYVLRNEQIPIYVVNQSGKWIVMIQEGNRRYDIWNLSNDTPNAKIPNFNVKRELLSSSQQKMYDEIRTDIFAHDEDSMKSIINSRDKLFKDIKDNAESVLENFRNFHENWNEYIKDLIEYWEALEIDMKSILNAYKERLYNVNIAFDKTKNDFDIATFEGQHYTRIILGEYKNKLTKAVDLAQDNYDEYDYKEAIDDIEEVKDNYVPLDEDDYDDAMNVLEYYDFVQFELTVPEWEEIYEESYYLIETSDHGYHEYFNHIYDMGQGNASVFIKDSNNFIKFSYIDPSPRNHERNGNISDDEIQEIFDDNDMY